MLAYALQFISITIVLCFVYFVLKIIFLDSVTRKKVVGFLCCVGGAIAFIIITGSLSLTDRLTSIATNQDAIVNVYIESSLAQELDLPARYQISINNGKNCEVPYTISDTTED